MNNNRTKIKELKALIEEEQAKIMDFLKEIRKDETEEEKKIKQEEFSKMRATVSSYQEEMKLVKMNKNLSSAFELVPNKTLNRKQRKEYAKMKRI